MRRAQVGRVDPVRDASCVDTAQVHRYTQDRSRESVLPFGAVAQLGARLNGIQKVRGSNPLGSTKHNPRNLRGLQLLALLRAT